MNETTMERVLAENIEETVTPNTADTVTLNTRNSVTSNDENSVEWNLESNAIQNVEHIAETSATQNAEPGVTIVGDTIPDPANRKPTVHVLVISDVTCPWCWIAKRSLENAMDLLHEKFNFDVQFSPFLLRPNCPKEGVPNPDFNNGEHPRNVLLSDVCNDLDIDLNFSCPTVPYSVPALTFRQYARESRYPNVVQSQVADRLHEAFFTHGQKLTTEDLLQIAKDLMLNTKEVAAYLDNPDNHRKVIEQAEAWRKRGVQAVPFFYMNGKAACSGAQETKDFIQMILKVAEQFPEEQMGDAAMA